MVGSFIHNPKYGVDITSYDNHTFLGITYRYNNRVFLISKCMNGRFEGDYVFLEALITDINELISSTKNLYYENLAKN